MDPNMAIVLVVSLLALVAVGFFLVFRSRGKAKFEGPFGIKGSLDGGNDPPRQAAGIKGQDLKAGGNLEAVNKGDGGIDVRRAEANGDITLNVEAPRGADDPKH